MKLLKELKRKPFCNDLHFFLFSVVLLLLALKYPLFFIILLFYMIFIYKKTNYFYYILILLLIILLHYKLINVNELNENKEYNGYIVDIEDDGYIVACNFTKIKIYDYSRSYMPGDIIKFELEIYDKPLKSYPNDFDYNQYLLSKGIKYQGKLKSSNLVFKFINLRNIKYNILNYLENSISKESYEYVSALIFADNNLDENLKEGYSILGISHILAISGMHIMLIFTFFKKVFLKLFKLYSDLIPIILILIYTAIIGFPSSCVRASLFLLLSFLNERGNIKYTRLDILSICFIIMILINPYQGYNSGFILSYLVSFILIFSIEIINSKNKFKNKYILHLIIYFITIPIISSFNNSISLSAILLAPILSLLIEYIIIPITYLICFIPYLDILFKYLYIFLNDIVLQLYEYSYVLSIPTFNIILAIIYYLILISIIVLYLNKKNIFYSIISLLLFIFVIANYQIAIFYTKITFIDVGQGDSSLIELPFNRGSMLIDTYNSLDYILSTGRNNIDYLVLTHSDLDHIKDCEKIIDRLNPKIILYPKYDKEFVNLLSKYNAIGIDYKNDFYLDNIFIDVLAPINEYSDKNSNSIVLRFNIDGYYFLFCGDMTIEEEYDVIKNNKIIKTDVLKVGHHGSSTSSSKEFLNLADPKYSIVSVGKNNKYNLPDIDVINRLNNISKVYQTKDSGNIEIYIYNNKLSINTYR